MLFNAKITDDNGQTIIYQIFGFSLQINAEDWLILTLQHNSGNETYYIHTDVREPILQLIVEHMLKEISIAITGKRDFEIEEYIARNYIFVGANSNIPQYTAHK